MKKPSPISLAIKQLRRDLNMTQEALAAKAHISVQYVRAIEGGYQDISDNIKRRIAKALNISVWALFPDVRGEVNLYNILIACHGPDLKIKEAEIPLFKEVLSRMNEDEFKELIVSGTMPEDVRRIILTWAKDHDIAVPPEK